MTIAPLIGAHMSISGGLHKAIDRAVDAGFNCLQIFTKSPSQWKAKPLTDEDAALFRSRWDESGLAPVTAHDSYLINLASPEEDKRQRSIRAFLDELDRCSRLGIPALVMHPGAHMGRGEEEGLKTLIASFQQIVPAAPDNVEILLENTAGMGSVLGASFEHLARVMDAVPDGQFGICLDTCHAFAAGYDLSTEEGYSTTIGCIEAAVGLDSVRVIHVNDSLKGCGSRLDRHAHPGQGEIGSEGFRCLMRDSRFASCPKILELPLGDDGELGRLNREFLLQSAKGEE